MRTTVVPAQITTVEDRIAGSLGLTQVMLLIAPVFGGSALFVILPPFFNYAAYKVGLVVLLALLCGLLAVRVKGKILLLWAVVLLRYNARPMYYVFNKNSLHTREVAAIAETEELAEQEVVAASECVPLITLAPADQLKVEELVTDPTANVRFTTTKKGELRVLLTEVPRESLGQTAN